MDELAHYAKPVAEGGKNLEVRMIIGSKKWAKTEIRRYLTHKAGGNDVRRRRKSALDRLRIRTWGRDPPYNPNEPYTSCRSRYSHAKTIVTSAGAMMGSYNFTFASRNCHFEDGVVIAPGEQVNELRADLQAIWHRGATVHIPGAEILDDDAPTQRTHKQQRFL